MRSYLKKLWVRRLLSLLILAALWEVLSRTGAIDPFYAPAPSEILRVVFSLFAEGTILNHLEATFTAALLTRDRVGSIFLGLSRVDSLGGQILEPIMML
jgi:NitT/TauT family transport system permease protein